MIVEDHNPSISSITNLQIDNYRETYHYDCC